MGFRISETMSGHHEFEPGCGPAGRHPFAFRLRWGPDRFADWLNPLGDGFLWQEAEGEVLVGGLCEWTPCRGTLSLEYGKARIRYTFDFNVAGVAYRYVGEKSNLRPWNLLVTHTTCFGTLVELESGKLISRSTVTYKLRSTPRFLASLRWA